MSRSVRLLLLAALVVVGAAYAYANHIGLSDVGDMLARALQQVQGRAVPGNVIESSGTLESRSVAVVAEVGGQIEEIKVSEGDVVAAGAVLVQLETTTQDVQLARARAAVDAAQAQLAVVKAGPRAEQVQQAQASLDRSNAARDGAELALKDIERMRANPQDIDAQLAQARGQLLSAQAAITVEQTQLRVAQIVSDRWKDAGDAEGKVQYQIANAQVRAAQAAVKTAQLTADGAQVALDMLSAMRDNPLALIAQVHAAQARYDQAVAAASVAQANLDAVSAGPTTEQIALAKAQVQQAEAALEQLQVQRDKMTLRAPTAGVVTALPVHAGENVQAGARLMTIANLDRMRFIVYVPESQIGRVKVGQSVSMKVDGLPDRAYQGKVEFISPQAEFTPTTVQTTEERAKIVFMVRVGIANDDHTLKPGMGADAIVNLE